MYFILTSPGTSSPEQLRDRGVGVCVEWNICITLIGQYLSGLWFASQVVSLKELLKWGWGFHTAHLTPSSLQKEETLAYCFPAPGDVLLRNPFCQAWSGPSSKAPAEICLVNLPLTSEADRAPTKEPSKGRAGTFWHWRAGQSNAWSQL